MSELFLTGQRNHFETCKKHNTFTLDASSEDTETRLVQSPIPVILYSPGSAR